jgi:pilus assembly protein Flp/PilA
MKQAIKTFLQEKEVLKTFLHEEEGLTTVEYAIAGSLVGAAVVLSFTNLGAAVKAVIDNITAAI